MVPARLLGLTLGMVAVLGGASLTWAEILPVLDGQNQPIDFTLAEVMAMPDGLRVGDKVFSDWAFQDNSDNGGLAPTPEGISVEGVFFDLNDNQLFDPLVDLIGLRFSGGWSAFSSQIADTVISYKVTADDPCLLDDLRLMMTAFGTDNQGTGMASISENVYSDPNLFNLLARRIVYDNDQGIQHLQDADFPPGYKEVWVVKDVVVNGGGSGMAHISQFYNVFSQCPEPSSLLLLGAGAALLIRRRK